jgi:ubiquinone/menaquinone biosynthesis C-methylase UbiE
MVKKRMSSYKTLNSPRKLASTITAFPFLGTDYLGFRDLPLLLEKYVLGKEALDVGCGAGRSTRFLKSIGYSVIGIDIFKSMLNKAKELDPVGDYRVISSKEEWPIGNKKFDVILFSFVLIELASKEDIKKALEKARQCLTKQGLVVILTTSEEAYKNDWLSMVAHFPEK